MPGAHLINDCFPARNNPEKISTAQHSLASLVKVYEGWMVRRLAPDCHRIELSELGPERDEKRMLRAMSWETGNIHLGTPNATQSVLKDLKAAGKMVKATLKDWQMWKAGNVDGLGRFYR